MEGVRVLSISDLLDLSRPLSGAASLLPASFSPPPPKRPKLDDPDENPIKPPLFSSDQNPNPTMFSPLGRPVLLIGTIDLFPWDSGRSLGCLNHCLSFSDGSSRVCCYILDFELKVIGREIHVLAWNFLPFKHESGVLEVLRWSLPEFEAASDCNPSLSIPSACSLQEAHLSAHGHAFGILRAVSPIFSVPCVKEREDGQKNPRGILMDSGDSIGFLAEILTCVCDLCGESRFAMENGRHPHEDNSCHSFTNSVFIYLIKPTFLWRPVLYRLIGKIIMVSRLKKKLVFVGSEDSYLMFVSTAVTMVSLSQHPVKAMPIASLVKSDEGTYIGVVTGIYMQGMVVELDDKVWLLITDPVLAPQHSLRVGAIVSVRSCHLVNAKYSWLKIFLLVTGPRTYISIKSFSMTDIRCHLKSKTESLMEKFIESLAFSAKFWVLLLVSCFKKKFGGIFSDRDILGSKKKEGFIQTYATKCLPPSAFQGQLGLFMSFCKHNQHSCRSELNLSFLKLVIPIANLTSWCEAIWVSMQAQKHSDEEIVRRNQYLDHFLCKETLPEHMIRRMIPSDNIGFILLGTLKISPCSGRLQLTDATGSIDAVVPDLPLDVDFQTVYEVKDYKLVLEGSPTQVDHLQCHFDGPLSCRAIFQQFSHRAALELSVYVHFYFRDSTCINFNPQVPCYMDKNESFNCSNGEMFHLFLVTHKFPVYQNHQDEFSLSNSSGLFAEALILPYNLIPIETNEHGELAEVFLDNLDKRSDWIGHLKDTTKHWSKQPEHVRVSNSSRLSGSVNISRDFERFCQVPCSLAFKSSNCQWSQLPVYLHNANKTIRKDHNSSDSRILLEFRSDSFSKYQMLHVGSYYLLKCSRKGLHYQSKGCEHMTYEKSLVTSDTSLWSLSFLFGEEKHPRELSKDQCSFVSSARTNEVCSTKNFQHEQMFLQFFDQTDGLSDVYLHISTEAIRQLEEIEPSQKHLNSLLPSLDETISVSSCIQKMMAEFAVPSRIIDRPINELPQGNQISLNGNIVNVIIYDCKPKSSVSSSCMAACNHWSICKICIYVKDDHHMVRIRGSLSRFACPVGLGPGTNATFHRVLLTRTSSRWNELVLTPMSFIVVNSVKELVSQHSDRSLIQESRWNIQHEEILNTISLGLISQTLQCMDSKLIRLHCRGGQVVTIITLVLENQTHESVELQSARYSKMSTASIPLAGFLLDDGSSLCSCWADYGRAETLLRLHEATQKLFFTSPKISKVFTDKDSRHTVGYHLHKMLKKHHRVIIRNHGAPDLSCEDLTFSFDSHKVFSNTEERLLRFIILNACHASTLNVAGKMMDSNALFSGNMEFLEYHQALQSVPHLWVREVGHVDPVKEARNICSDLWM